MAAPEIRTYTAEEFYADKSLPERCELINGDICFMSPSANNIHKEISANIHCDIINHIRKNKGKCKAYAEADVKLSEDTVVQPDIYVTCRPDKLDGQKHIGAPDWIIEIVSPSSVMHDYVTKLNLYHEAGVREYWIADPRKSMVHVYIWDGEVNEVNIYSFEDNIPVHIYKDNPERLCIKISEYLSQN